MSELQRADQLAGEAARQAAALEAALLAAERALSEAGLALRATSAPFEPNAEQARRIEEVARDSGEAMTRADLLALNFQVEAARLGEEDRHLHRAAHELRSLADRGARGAQEVSGLASAMQRDLRRLSEAWLAGLDGLGGAALELERARQAAQAAAQALAGARQVVAGLAAPGAGPGVDPGPASGLAAAAQVRAGTLARLGGAVGEGLRRAAQALLREAEAAEAVRPRLEAREVRLGQLEDLARAADEIGRRARQLAINADLAASRSEDPGFGLFAEEARRLSEQAEATAEVAQRRFEEFAEEREPLRALERGRADALRALARELEELAARFGEGPAGDADLAQAWREDQRAADELQRALEAWRGG